MTVQNTSRRVGPYVGNGVTTSFPFDFKVFEATDVEVNYTDASGISSVITTNYTVTLNPDQDANPGGSISYPTVGSPLSASESLVFIGDMPYDQETDITNAGRFLAQVVENALDKVTILCQQLLEVTSRTLRLPAASTANATLPDPVSNNLLGWNSLGTAIINYAGVASVAVSSFMATVLAAANAAAARATLGALGVSDVPNYLSGFTMSTGGGSIVMTIATGAAADTTNTAMIARAGFTKTTLAWALGDGAGGLDTGVIANSTWYHWYAIRNPTTQSVDAICSLSPTAPALPSGFTQYRRIRTARTDGSGKWVPDRQEGDTVWYATISADVAANNPGTSGVTRALNTPPGLVVEAIVEAAIAVDAAAATGSGAHIEALAVIDVAATIASGFQVFCSKQAANNYNTNLARVLTNSAGQIRTRLSASDANTTLYVQTIGYVDSRGRNG